MPHRSSPRDLERIVRGIFDLWGGKTAGRGRSRSPRVPNDPRALLTWVAVAAIVLIFAWFASRERPVLIPGGAVPRTEDGFLFVSWNVENFFDDRDDPANHDADEDWFGTNPDAFALKVKALTDAVLLENSGHGPDILAMVEVESRRCVEALQESLNRSLPQEFRYTGIVQQGDKTGRRFAPAILTRLAIRDDLTRGPRDFDNRRILEAHLEADGVPLVVLASHWTSRLRGEDASEGKRLAYADKLYARYLYLRQETPGIDVIFAGDFNDTPEDKSLVESLHTVDQPALVNADNSGPNLLDLVANPRLKGRGTYFYKGHWDFLDHILAPAELLDSTGWTIGPESLTVGDFQSLSRGANGAPWKFGGPKQTGPRGYSDHFSLGVRLRLNAPKPAN